jgi:C4-dicarboxylate-specific signal transduction histidine kinase
MRPAALSNTPGPTDSIENLEMILSVLRHQLGNSVSAIKVTLDVLKENFDKFDDQKKKVYLERGAELIKRQHRMVKAMKSYALFNAKEKQDIAFDAFWELLIGLASDKLAHTKIKLTTQNNVTRRRIRVNQMALSKAMEIIIDNAIDALTLAEAPEICITASIINNSIVIDMSDNGHGIKMEDIPKIFIPLYTTKPDSMGMGLPIAQKLLMEMDGRIEIKSRSGGGTQAKVCIGTAQGH